MELDHETRSFAPDLDLEEEQGRYISNGCKQGDHHRDGKSSGRKTSLTELKHTIKTKNCWLVCLGSLLIIALSVIVILVVALIRSRNSPAQTPGLSSPGSGAQPQPGSAPSGPGSEPQPQPQPGQHHRTAATNTEPQPQQPQLKEESDSEKHKLFLEVRAAQIARWNVDHSPIRAALSATNYLQSYSNQYQIGGDYVSSEDNERDLYPIASEVLDFYSDTDFAVVDPEDAQIYHQKLKGLIGEVWKQKGLNDRQTIDESTRKLLMRRLQLAFMLYRIMDDDTMVGHTQKKVGNQSKLVYVNANGCEVFQQKPSVYSLSWSYVYDKLLYFCSVMHDRSHRNWTAEYGRKIMDEDLFPRSSGFLDKVTCSHDQQKQEQLYTREELRQRKIFCYLTEKLLPIALGTNALKEKIESHIKQELYARHFSTEDPAVAYARDPLRVFHARFKTPNGSAGSFKGLGFVSRKGDYELDKEKGLNIIEDRMRENPELFTSAPP